MSGKRQNNVDLLATKSDIIKDIVSETISSEIHKESGIACSKRENTEIRVNISKLEKLVKKYDLNNSEKEVPFYDFIEKKEQDLIDFSQLKCYEILKSDLIKARRNA